MTPDEMVSKIEELNLNVEFYGETRKHCLIFADGGIHLSGEGSTIVKAFENALSNKRYTH